MSDPIEDLRKNVRLLEPDGDDGFEGLIAAVLSDLTKRSFALASAGSQRGKDGQSALDGAQIMFEAKRYDDQIGKDKLYTKIFEVAADNTSTPELYIVGATCPISAQHVTTLQAGARRLGMTLFAFAWPETGLPELAALLAMTPQVSAGFVAKHTEITERELANQLEAVREHPQFKARSDELLAILRQPSIAPAYALQDNIAWLSEAFSDKKRARSVFGQALCPGDASISGTIDRTLLRAKVADHIFTKPNGVITAILGSDGNGKSWIVAQAWARQPNRPLTIVIVPNDINELPSPEHCQDLLISKILAQTGDSRTVEAKDRWLKHFERWRRAADTATPRVVVFMDGINQRANVDWLRFLDAMSEVVANLSGRLVVSCRSVFYHDNLKNKLVSEVAVVDVPEWTDIELDALLKARGASIAVLDPRITRSLRNPRLFGIAAALFEEKEVKEFGELSVNRLLFEHIRIGAAEGAAVSSKQFVADMCSHAESIVQRLKQQQDDSVAEFDLRSGAMATHSNPAFSEKFVITSAGRFFEVLDENPNKYVLKDEGLPLALGLALVRAAREALRKKKSVDAALSNILDPIAALDRTGDILLGAIMAAVVESRPKEVVTPLVRSFVMLQNLDSTRYPEFRSLFGRDPSAFLVALEEAVLTSDIASNLSWLTDAAKDLRGGGAFEAIFTATIHRWLNMYSLAPERMLPPHSKLDLAIDRKKQLMERSQELSAAVASLSKAESDLLEEMILEDRGDYSELHALAFEAMAGRPLAPFARSLRNWCFAASLNSGYNVQHAAFGNLLDFNLADWASTKDAMQKAANLLRQSGISITGQWALVYVLRATGDSSDAREADGIFKELTKDWTRFRTRRVEDYCATDPCDPASAAPDNIDKTASDYRAIEPSELRRHMGYRLTEYFFEEAQPGLARFRPQAAVEVLRALADDAVKREQPGFRQAVFMLENHTVGLEDRVADPYLRKAAMIAQAALDSGEDKNDEAWVAAQYALCVAFPHMSGDAQFDTLMNHPQDRTILLELCYLFQPIDESKLERALEEAVKERDLVAQFRVLGFAEHSHTPLTQRTKELVLSLLTSEDCHVRLSAIALIRITADPILLSGFVKSGWSVATLEAVTHKVEILNGSLALVMATSQGMLTLEACLDRIALSAYESLAEKLGADAALAIADRLTTAIQKAADFKVAGNLPNIEQTFEGRHWSVVYEVSERSSNEESPYDSLRRLSESGDAWYERQKQNRAAADRFEQALTKAGAQLIVQSVTAALIFQIDRVAPAVVDTWHEQFLKLDSKAIKNVHNIALLVAETMSKRNATASLMLFKRLRASSPHVRVTFGENKIVLDAFTAWGAADTPEIKELRFARLDSIGNDHDLAMEVLAAIRAKRADCLREYVVDRRGRPEPAHRARASMVAGLSLDEPWAVETVDMLKVECGFLQRAYEAAKYAMERHQWSRHWADQMRTAIDPVDLWRFTVLLSRIVDGRFEGTEVAGDAPSPLIKRFGTTLNDPIRKRIHKWKSKRDSKLFGMNAPSAAFLVVVSSSA